MSHIIKLNRKCDQNWYQMQDTENGKYCKICSQNVYDFTNSTSDEIIKVFNKNKGSVCGKYSNKQLYKTSKKSSNPLNRGIALTFIMNFFSVKSEAKMNFIENNNIFEVSESKTQNYLDKNDILSQIESKDSTDLYTLKGIIYDDVNEPLPGVIVSKNGTNEFVVTNEKGEFNLPVQISKMESILIMYRFIGFNVIEKSYKVSDIGNLQKIIMTTDNTQLGGGYIIKLTLFNRIKYFFKGNLKFAFHKGDIYIGG